MKNRFLGLATGLLASTTLMFSCSKTADIKPAETSNSYSASNETAKLSFTRKAYVEDFTGAWCGWCPLMAFNLDSMHATQPNLIAVGVHDGDVMASGSENNVEALCSGFAGFPTGFVNRNDKATQFNIVQKVPAALAKAAKAGLQIETTLTGSTLSAKVTTGFGSDFSASNITLAIMLVEDGIKEDQHTYYYHTKYVSPTNILYSTKDLLTGWVHNGVLRKYATTEAGDAVPAAKTTAGNKTYSKTVTFDLSGYKSKKCRVVAIIIQKGATIASNLVLNAQTVKAGQTQLFD